jgi:hypothetical protein
MSSKEYTSLHALFKKCPWRTFNKFSSLAHRYGFTNDNEIKSFLKTVIHDEIPPEPKYLPIFSETPDAYQMDIVFIDNKIYLVFININTRKAYIENLVNKSAKSVKTALSRFIAKAHPKSLQSDQDSAFLAKEILGYLKDQGIRYRTISDNDHHILGIINRFIRTIRDLSSDDSSNEDLKNIIKEYNKTPHSSLSETLKTEMSPNQMTPDAEQKYIKLKEHEFQLILSEREDIPIGTKVRLVIDKDPLKKTRSNLSKTSYIVDSIEGNQYLIKSIDGSIDKVPFWKIVPCDSHIPLAKTIKNGKRGIIERIKAYNPKKDTYLIIYDEGTEDWIPARNLREGNPLNLSKMEKEYWKDKEMPESIRKWLE